MDNAELKKCPFCHSSNVTMNDDNEDCAWWVECDMCDARGPVELFPHVAANSWNDWGE